jgi:hypothetical protein
MLLPQPNVTLVWFEKRFASPRMANAGRSSANSESPDDKREI